MKPYAIQTKDVREEHLQLLAKIKVDVAEMPDDWDCHQVVMTLAQKYPNCKPQRGYFGAKGIEHSWLDIPQDEIIIDPYPWAGIEPFIITYVGLLNPWRFIYIPTDPPPEQETPFYQCRKGESEDLVSS